MNHQFKNDKKFLFKKAMFLNRKLAQMIRTLVFENVIHFKMVDAINNQKLCDPLAF